nr:MAG TPA: hypothetical protein [Caudoviricetes sp.]
MPSVAGANISIIMEMHREISTIMEIGGIIGFGKG